MKINSIINIMKINFLPYLIIVVLFFSFNISLAQNVFNSSSFFDFDIGLSTSSPLPFEKVKASIKNENFDVSRSDIIWILNGKTMREGKNENLFLFKTGDLGSVYEITVMIFTPNGIKIEKTKTLYVVDLDLLWQAETYTPYFYKGKALVSPLSKINFGAVPHFVFEGQKISKEKLLFKWYVNEDFETEGWGKDSFSFKTGIFNGDELEIKVNISSGKETLNQSKTTFIKNMKPEIKFYEYNNLDNVKYEKAIYDFQINSGENRKFIAEPFFISKENVDKINYNWEINGIKSKKTEPRNILNFSSEAGFLGTGNVKLKINYNNLLEEIISNFRILIK